MRFKVTTDAGRVFYVYAGSQSESREVFKSGYGPGVLNYPGPVSRVDVEEDEDQGQWKTTLQEGPTKSGGTVSGS